MALFDLPVANCADCIFFYPATESEFNRYHCVRKNPATWAAMESPVTAPDKWCGRFMHNILGERFKGNKQQWRFPTEKEERWLPAYSGSYWLPGLHLT